MVEKREYKLKKSELLEVRIAPLDTVIRTVPIDNMPIINPNYPGHQVPVLC